MPARRFRSAVLVSLSMFDPENTVVQKREARGAVAQRRRATVSHSASISMATGPKAVAAGSAASKPATVPSNTGASSNSAAALPTGLKKPEPKKRENTANEDPVGASAKSSNTASAKEASSAGTRRESSGAGTPRRHSSSKDFSSAVKRECTVPSSKDSAPSKDGASAKDNVSTKPVSSGKDGAPTLKPELGPNKGAAAAASAASAASKEAPLPKRDAAVTPEETATLGKKPPGARDPSPSLGRPGGASKEQSVPSREATVPPPIPAKAAAASALGSKRPSSARAALAGAPAAASAAVSKPLASAPAPTLGSAAPPTALVRPETVPKLPMLSHGLKPASAGPLVAKTTASLTAGAAAGGPAAASTDAPSSQDFEGEVRVSVEGDEERIWDDERNDDGLFAPASAAARLHLSPVRLRMGWRRNGELEIRTSELQHMLEVLQLPGALPKSGAAPRAGSPAGLGRHAIDATVRRFEAQQQRLELLEREMESIHEAKRQALASRAEMVKRFEEEKKRADGLDIQQRDTKSRLARAERQIELLRTPSGEAAEDEAADASDKPKPMHMRLKEEEQKRNEKRHAMQQQLEQGRTYAPKIDPTSATMQREKKSEPSKVPEIPLDATDMAVLSFKGRPAGGKPEAKAVAKTVLASVEDSIGDAPPTSWDADPADNTNTAELQSSLDALNAELSRERRSREVLEAQIAKATSSEAFAVSRREEVELMMQRMASKERDQNAEVVVARRQAKEATNELAFVRKIAEAAQADAAQKSEEARILSRERTAWEAERAKSRARAEEAEILAKELSERVKVAEEALKSIANAPPPADGAVKQQRKARGIQDHPNAELVQKQQQMAKLQAARLEAEDAKRRADKVERDLHRAKEEMERLQGELERAQDISLTGTPNIAGQQEKTTVAEVSLPQMEDSKAALKRGISSTSVEAKGRGANGKKETSIAALQNILRGDVEEATLVRELSGMEQELHAAKILAHGASSSLANEKQLRIRAESSLDRFTRISALQHAAQEALNASLRHEDDPRAEDLLGRALADVNKLRTLGSHRVMEGARSSSSSPRTDGADESFSGRGGLGSSRGMGSVSARQGTASPRAASPRAQSPRATSLFAPPALQAMAALPLPTAPAAAWGERRVEPSLAPSPAS